MTAEAVAEPEPKLIIDLKTNECKFPVAERDGQHLFCGKRRYDSNTSYCSRHLRKMYAESKPRPIAPPPSR